MPPTAPQDRKRKSKTTTRVAEPVPMPSSDPNDKFAPTAWGGFGPGIEELTVPSGQLCLARRPGVQGLIQAGVLNDIDTLTAIVEEKHVKRVEGRPEIDAQSLMGDTESIANVIHVVDRVLCYVVIKPEVVMTPNDPTSRKDGVIYADMVELEDKMFVFNFAVGGTRDLETFRRERDEALGSVDDLEAAGDKAE